MNVAVLHITKVVEYVIVMDRYVTGQEPTKEAARRCVRDAEQGGVPHYK